MTAPEPLAVGDHARVLVLVHDGHTAIRVGTIIRLTGLKDGMAEGEICGQWNLEAAPETLGTAANGVVEVPARVLRRVVPITTWRYAEGAEMERPQP